MLIGTGQEAVRRSGLAWLQADLARIGLRLAHGAGASAATPTAPHISAIADSPIEITMRMDDIKTVEKRANQGVAGRLFQVLSATLKRRAGMPFHPAGSLRPEAAAGHWRTEGFDSYFYVPMQCQPGLLLVSFDATLCEASIDHRNLWRLYFDIGEGFREEDCLIVNSGGARIEIETTITLPAPALAFRIDPCAQSNRFVLHKLALTPLAALQPPSERVPHRLVQLRRWWALLRKIVAARFVPRGRQRRRLQDAARLPLAGLECGA